MSRTATDVGDGECGLDGSSVYSENRCEKRKNEPPLDLWSYILLRTYSGNEDSSRKRTFDRGAPVRACNRRNLNSACLCVPGVLSTFLGWSGCLQRRLEQSKAAVCFAVAISQFGLEGVPSEASDKVAKQPLRTTT